MSERIKLFSGHPKKWRNLEEYGYAVHTAILSYDQYGYYCACQTGRDKRIAQIDDEGITMNPDFKVPLKCPYQLEQQMYHEISIDRISEQI